MEHVASLFRTAPWAVFLLAAVGVAFLMLPGIAAFVLQREQRRVILKANLVFVWSSTVWALLLAWALTGRAGDKVMARISGAGGTRGNLALALTLALISAVPLVAIAAYRVLSAG